MLNELPGVTSVYDKPIAELWRDFALFSNGQLVSKDIDPAYHVLSARFAIDGCDFIHSYWRLALYLTFYHLGSAEHWWTQEPEPGRHVVARVYASSTGTERRGMRGNTPLVQTFLGDMIAPQMVASVRRAQDAGGKEGWKIAYESIQNFCRGAGTWAGYKWADLLKNVLNLPITANDLGLGGGGKYAGPIPGLARLTGRPWEECASDLMLQENAYEKALSLGIRFNGLDQFETCLCDFNSLAKGHYYVGHDIDNMQAQLKSGSTLWAARRAGLPNEYLGELNGWEGPDPKLNLRYAQTGKVFSRIGEAIG